MFPTMTRSRDESAIDECCRRDSLKENDLKLQTSIYHVKDADGHAATSKKWNLISRRVI